MGKHTAPSKGVVRRTGRDVAEVAIKAHSVEADAHADEEGLSKWHKHLICILVNGTIALGLVVMGDHMLATYASTVVPTGTVVAVEAIDRFF